MIEFNGYISGKAKKHYESKVRALGIKIIVLTLLTLLPTAVFFTVQLDKISILGYYFLLCVILLFAVLIPKPKKERNKQLPKKIFVENDCIICMADAYTESKFIEDVKEVIEYDEFYDIIFSFGNLSDKYVCQKSLLTKGTIEEFEALFEGKITNINQGTVL